MKAKDVMTRHVITIAPDASIVEALRLMLQHRISGLPAVDNNGTLAGIVTEGDFLRRAETGTQRKRPRWVELQTIAYGVRSGNAKAHESAMPAFGKDGLLKPNEIVAVANYVRSLSELSVRPGVDLAAGKKIFADNCAACHGADGTGNQELGAPNLTERIWLYGPDEATIIDTITNSRSGVMPAWVGRLDPATIKALAVYVHTLGGGK